MSDNSVHLVSQETNQSIKEWKHPKRINDFIIIEDVIIVGGYFESLYKLNNF